VPGRVLFLAYLFPPIQNSGTQRPTKFVKYLREFGWEPEVVTGEPPPDLPQDRSLLDELPADVPVHRAGLLNEAIAASLARLGARRLGDAISWRMSRHWRSPDIYAPWRPLAARICRRILASRRFDAVFATGYPWSSLLVGEAVARQAGLPFIADFRDVWTMDDPYREHPPTNQEIALERDVVRNASAVICVSDVMTERMRAFHSAEPPAKFHTIWNGFDPQDIAAAESNLPKRPGVLRVVYTGVWRPTYNPLVLYDAIDLLRRRAPETVTRLEVITAGFSPRLDRDASANAGIVELGPMSHANALALMKTADVLFSPLPPGSYQTLAIPGKIFEYAAVGKPMLCTADNDGEVARFFRRVGGGRIVPLQAEAVARVLETACAAGQLEVPPVDALALSHFERRNLTGSLAAILDRVSAR
jgi:glycosyltransferase involved in cell wall biosynthesis